MARLSCFVRAGVFLLTAIANQFRLKPINVQEQFLMAYGGLRGAVSFSLVEMLESDAIRPRQMFVTTTLIVILFTVFVQVSHFRALSEVDLLHDHAGPVVDLAALALRRFLFVSRSESGAKLHCRSSRIRWAEQTVTMATGRLYVSYRRGSMKGGDHQTAGESAAHSKGQHRHQTSDRRDQRDGNRLLQPVPFESTRVIAARSFQMIYHITAGIEEICGKRGNNYFRVSASLPVGLWRQHR